MPSPVRLDRSLISDAAFSPIADKIERGERLSAEDGVALFASPDLLGLGHMADAVNRAKHGNRVTFAANQHINPTNICILRKTCVFCSYARLPKEEGAYRYTMDQVWAEAETANSTLTREFHIVGGLDMHAGLAYYVEMFRGLKERHPNVHIKALTAVEIAHIARIDKLSVRDTLIALREAGLDTMPGGGAEVFADRVRRLVAPGKESPETWFHVHDTAHRLGIPTHCTMLYGHVETYEERVDHILRLRDQQDRTGGFLAFIPLAFHPENTVFERRGWRHTTGADDLKMLAFSRLMLDNVENIKAYWIMMGMPLAAIALHFGANDVQGTVVREQIFHAAGARTETEQKIEELVRFVRDAGRTPVQRDTLYNELRRW